MCMCVRDQKPPSLSCFHSEGLRKASNQGEGGAEGGAWQLGPLVEHQTEAVVVMCQESMPDRDP